MPYIRHFVNIQDVQKSFYFTGNMSDMENTVLDELWAFHGVDNKGSGTVYSHRRLPRFLRSLMLPSSIWSYLRM
jgi:hypothetical protein